MSNTTTRRSTPPRPVLFAKRESDGITPVMSFKEKGCQLVALDKSHKLGLSLQKCRGEHVVNAAIHTARVSTIHNLGQSGMSVSFEVKDNWMLTSTVFMKREEMENLRDRLNAFLAEH